MRLSPKAGLSLAAMVVAAGLGVGAQTNSSSATGAAASPARDAARVPAAPVVNPAPAKNSPLADAVQRRDKQAVQALLKKKADVNAPQRDGATALHWAAYLKDAETDGAADPRRRQGQRHEQLRRDAAGARREARQREHHRSVDEGGRRSERLRELRNAGETPLMLAARAGNADAVKVLLIAGAQVNAQETWNGQTALMWAAAEGHAASCKR